MTTHATRDGQKVTIHHNTGVHAKVVNSQVHEVQVEENAQHLRHFYSQLGQLLDEADAERNAEQPERLESSGYTNGV